tara:strand:+ start:63 stop:530 length:468 start_codon:yes stop_codon:yes gene_type:complete
MANRQEIGHTIGYAGASILFLRFVPLLYEQFTKPREMNIFFLNLELLASVFCGTSAMFLGAIPLFIANSLSFVCITTVLLIQYRIKYKKKHKTKETERDKSYEQKEQIENDQKENDQKQNDQREIPYCKFLPLFKLQKVEEPEKISQVYNTIARN